LNCALRERRTCLICAIRGVINKHKQNDYLKKFYKLKTNTRLKKLTGPKKHNRSIQERTFLLKMKTPKSDTHFSAVESSSDVPLLLLVSFGGGNLNSNLAAIQIGILHGGKKYLHQNII
jgi:hypothetical protein